MSLPDAQRAKFLAWAADRWRADAYRHTSETSGEWDAWQAAHRYATEAIAAQAAEVEALRADAERYRIWRHEFTGNESDEATPVIIALNDAWTPEAVDAVLDAARAALKERAPNVRCNAGQTAQEG